jgi:S-adenosylmethionine:tRNA ribosyltransferase-isomerase
MRTQELDFSYPSDLVALEPVRPTRVAWCEANQPPRELTLDQLLEKFTAKDLLVVNQTQVIPARVFSIDNHEILFLKAIDDLTWQVLFPARDFKQGDVIAMPGALELTLVAKNLPQTVKLSRPLTLEYFSKYGEMALPPYIQAGRGERRNRELDHRWYQSIWAKQPGSVAAPTASLHFTPEHLEKLPAKLAYVVLHVGAGTFLPVRTENISDHQMHEEWVHIPRETLESIKLTKQNGGRIWALGTTVTRALESHAQGILKPNEDGETGATQIFLYPPYRFKIVDVLMTNFHQPKSTLLALVAAFAGIEHAKQVYQWAIERKFKLFSYGDLSVWTLGRDS